MQIPQNYDVAFKEVERTSSKETWRYTFIFKKRQ